MECTKQIKEILTMSMDGTDVKINVMTAPKVNVNYIFIATKPLGRNPVKMTCPHCYKDIVTVIDCKTSARTHLTCILFSLIGCILCAPCVYCSYEFRAKEHYCPTCFSYLGSYDG